ncbi:uncharacterized protein ACIBXB_010885 isoform 2-T2 [Morphnus guianensis]
MSLWLLMFLTLYTHNREHIYILKRWMALIQVGLIILGILHAQVGVKAVMTLTWYSSQSTMLQVLFCKGLYKPMKCVWLWIRTVLENVVEFFRRTSKFCIP